MPHGEPLRLVQLPTLASATVNVAALRWPCGGDVNALSPLSGPERRITLHCVFEPDEAQSVRLLCLGLSGPGGPAESTKSQCGETNAPKSQLKESRV